MISTSGNMVAILQRDGNSVEPAESRMSVDMGIDGIANESRINNRQGFGRSDRTFHPNFYEARC